MEYLEVGEISTLVTRKAIKHVHLSVHPPTGRVTLVAPVATPLDVARAYAISRLGWIREQKSKLRSQAREAPSKFVERESRYLWGDDTSLPSSIGKPSRSFRSTIGASRTQYARQ